jgi:type I restriction enzyme S subunit
MERYFIDEEKFNELKSFEVKSGDIIISCSGVYLGKLAIIQNNYSKGIINQALLKLTLDKNIIIDKIFVFFWNNLMNNGFFDEVKKGAAIPNMPSVKELKEIDIPLPPLQIQQKTVNYLDEISEKIEKVKLVQKDKLNSLKALKASILDKAFRGEL